MSTAPLGDSEVLQKARSAANSHKFVLRFENDYESPVLQAEYDTRRQAEVALLANLAFWTDRDRDQMWRLFKQSELYRDELERFPQYKDEILTEAAALPDETYSPDED